MLSLRWPLFLQRLTSKPKRPDVDLRALSQEEIRALQRMRNELAAEREKQRLLLLRAGRITF